MKLVFTHLGKSSWYLLTWESPGAFHPIPQEFSQCCSLYNSYVGLMDRKLTISPPPPTPSSILEAPKRRRAMARLVVLSKRPLICFCHVTLRTLSKKEQTDVEKAISDYSHGDPHLSKETIQQDNLFFVSSHVVPPVLTMLQHQWRMAFALEMT